MADIFELLKQIAPKADTSSSVPEFLIAGLGNPGDKYAFTRHNAGFLAMDYLSQKVNAEVKQLKFKSLIGRATVGGHSVLLMKPQTYMNLSGEAIREAADYYKIKPEHILVLVDDIYQAPGKLRIRANGSAGGHNGLKNIIEHLGSEAFPRIRIGVGEKPNPEYPLADWVTGKIPEPDQKKLFSVFGCVADAVPMILDGKPEDAMCRYNGVSF